MKLSFDWLTDYVDLSGITPKLLAEQMTMGAFEVEGIESFGADITGPVVVGEIVDIQAHPDPKVTKMRMTKVKVDDKQEPLEIVCGAQNLAIGQRVPVALPGSIVINRHDGTAFPIIVVEKRGVRSNGMICAAGELGITYGAEEDGILVLDPTIATRLGDDIRGIVPINKDYVLTVGSRSNRGDAVCVRGMAREVAALFQRPLREPEWQLIENAASEKNPFTVQIDNAKDCEYFSIRALSGIKIGPAPSFIIRRLAAVGTRSVNNLVDITNYVMHEWGQPLHAYDARYVTAGKFYVRRGKNGEKYTTLDGKERILTDETLIISDTEKVIGMPVMGGANTEIRDHSKDIALEAASFNPAQVRRTSRLLGLSSESGLRFERGVDSATTKQASDRAAYLITKYCTGNEPVKVGSLIAGGQAEHPPLNVDLRLSQIKRYLDLDLSAEETKTLLGRLGFVATTSASDKLTFSVPSFRRGDVQREIDLIEEVCRLYGYDNIKDSTPSFFALAQMPENIAPAICQSLVGQGFCEAYASSLVPSVAESTDAASTCRLFAPEDPKRLIQMRNPLSTEHQVMRQSLLSGLIQALKYNRDRSQKDVWLFEIGNVYFKNESTSNQKQSTYPAREELKVAGIFSGNRQLSLWQMPDEKKQIDFYIAKGVLQNLFISLSIPIENIEYNVSSDSATDAWLMHPGQRAKITFAGENKVDLGWLGQIHPMQTQIQNLDPHTYIFELDVAALQKIQTKPRFSPIPTLAPVSRDLTVDLPQETENAAILKCIKDTAKHLAELDLVSVFPLNETQKSFSYRLVFQSEEETFKNEEIEQIMTNVRKALKEKLSASFRG